MGFQRIHRMVGTKTQSGHQTFDGKMIGYKTDRDVSFWVSNWVFKIKERKYFSIWVTQKKKKKLCIGKSRIYLRAFQILMAVQYWSVMFLRCFMGCKYFKKQRVMCLLKNWILKRQHTDICSLSVLQSPQEKKKSSKKKNLFS